MWLSSREAAESSNHDLSPLMELSYSSATLGFLPWKAPDVHSSFITLLQNSQRPKYINNKAAFFFFLIISGTHQLLSI